jgi:glycosyltransferase involved in cell wall biosynthesis
LVYSLFDVVLLTSAVEGLPNTLIEAQAAGRPVTTTDVGGASEAIIDGVTGILVRERSPQALAAAVLSILADPAWGLRASTEAPAFVARRFGLDRLIDETLAIYGVPPRRKA